MENKYLEKIASWQEPTPPNKYLEKIAGFTNWIGGAMKTIRGGGGAAGSMFKSVDNAVGSIVRTGQKAFTPKLPTDMAGLKLKTPGGSSITGLQSYQRNIKADAKAGRSALAGGPNETSKLPQGMKDDIKGNRQEFFNGLREGKGTVKDLTKGTSTMVDGKITSKTQGYQAPTSKFNATADNKYLNNVNNQINKNTSANQRIGTARAKIGLGVAGVAGAGALGYHMANKSNNNQQVQYGDMPY